MSFKDFLKEHYDFKYDEEFLDEFFGIAPENNNDEFFINLETVAKWTKIRKDNIKRVLKQEFVQDEDYIIEYKQLSKGGSEYETILLSSDCFKELCMILRSDKSKQVRKYYIKVERLLKLYHNEINQNLKEKINKLLVNQRPKYRQTKRGKMGGIYIFEALNDFPKLNYNKDEKRKFKMGMTEDIDSRFNTYNSGNANNIDPLFILKVERPKEVEACIKSCLIEFQYRKGKEIYEIELSLLKLICIVCAKLNSMVHDNDGRKFNGCNRPIPSINTEEFRQLFIGNCKEIEIIIDKENNENDDYEEEDDDNDDDYL